MLMKGATLTLGEREAMAVTVFPPSLKGPSNVSGLRSWVSRFFYTRKSVVSHVRDFRLGSADFFLGESFRLGSPDFFIRGSQ